MNLLEIKNLKTYFYSDAGVNKAVNDVSFDIPQGKTVCIVGESGSGKSITAMSIMQLIDHPGKIEGGEILLDGKNLLALSDAQMRQVRGRDISMIFQEPMTSLNPSYTVGYQIDEALKLHHKHLSKQERFERVVNAMDLVGIPDPKEKYREYPFKLSGGQRQRVMIAIAMACEPKLLIADEPTTALDVTIQAQVLDLMKKLQDDTDTSILFITHDLGVVYQIADEVVVMYRGHIVEKASAKELFEDPRHPYTKALLHSIPKPGITPRKTRLETVDDTINYLSFPKEIR